jgi:hypothetical protein
MFDAAESEISGGGTSDATGQSGVAGGLGSGAAGTADTAGASGNGSGASGGSENKSGPAAGAEGQNPSADTGRQTAEQAAAAADQQAAALAAAAKERPDTVPVHALHEARETAKQLRAKVQELEKNQLNAEERAALQAFREQQAAAQAAEKARKDQEADPAPDFLKDPRGYVDWQARQAARELKAVKDEQAQAAQLQAAQVQIQQVLTHTDAAERAFQVEHPDYTDALTHIRQSRTRQLKLLHPEATTEQINDAIGKEEIAIAHRLLSAGRDPAAFAYEHAQTIGYTPKAKAAAGGTAAAGTQAGTISQRVEDKSAARSLGTGGDSEGADLSAEPESEFAAAKRERFSKKR